MVVAVSTDFAVMLVFKKLVSMRPQDSDKQRILEESIETLHTGHGPLGSRPLIDALAASVCWPGNGCFLRAPIKQSLQKMCKQGVTTEL
mmetsp:Transcript_68532/g.198526  ORF Transcript_68532/g.198526 Transcript_68532/m.198526 type:complete len:89 (+) Transcript_68532:185-451(+)